VLQNKDIIDKRSQSVALVSDLTIEDGETESTGKVNDGPHRKCRTWEMAVQFMRLENARPVQRWTKA